MEHDDIIRAWKDEEYRNSLSEEQRAQLPENPAGMVELSDEAMQNVGGGLLSIFGCNGNGGKTMHPVLVCAPSVGGVCNPSLGLRCNGGGSTFKILGKNRC